MGRERTKKKNDFRGRYTIKAAWIVGILGIVATIIGNVSKGIKFDWFDAKQEIGVKEDTMTTFEPHGKSDDSSRTIAPPKIKHKRRNKFIAVDRQNHANKVEYAILILDENNKPSAITNEVANMVRLQGNHAVTNLFNKSFMKIGFESIYSGNVNNEIIQPFSNYVDFIILGRLSRNTRLNERNMHKVKVDLHINTYDAKDFTGLSYQTSSGEGLGFHEDESYEQAIKELKKQIQHLRL
ncbi:MAG: hypothetical protein AAGA64_16750 [Bacteroidota bacterium]